MKAPVTKSFRIKPETQVVELAKSELLERLNQSALIVYLRLIAASATRGRSFVIKNSKLHTQVRAARRALVELEQARLVRMTFTLTEDGPVRTIEIL